MQHTLATIAAGAALLSNGLPARDPLLHGLLLYVFLPKCSHRQKAPMLGPSALRDLQLYFALAMIRLCSIGWSLNERGNSFTGCWLAAGMRRNARRSKCGFRICTASWLESCVTRRLSRSIALTGDGLADCREGKALALSGHCTA